MVEKKLSCLFALLHCSNKDIAEEALLAPSHLSRIRNGQRQCTHDTRKQLSQALVSYSHANNRLPDLLEFLSLPKDSSKAVALSALDAWLTDDEEPTDKQLSTLDSLGPWNLQRQEVHRDQDFDFADKLNRILAILEYSNAYFSRLIHIDPSYMSHLRRGRRALRQDSDVANAIVSLLAAGIWQKDRLQEACAIMDPTSSPLKSLPQLESALRDWLFSADSSKDKLIATTIMNSISQYSPSLATHLPSLARLMPRRIFDDNKNSYHGKDGLRRAVLRFLGNAYKDKAKELLLYSDQDMEWITDDEKFFTLWKALLLGCLKAGIKVTMIHDMQRDTEEMAAGFEGWAPLYFSGSIHSYYMEMPISSPFSHTLFVCPGYAAIEGMNIRGQEDKGIYSYKVSEKSVNQSIKTYENLLSIAKPLAKTYVGLDPFDMSIFGTASGRLLATRYSLPFETLPLEVFQGVLKGSGLPGKERERLLDRYYLIQEQFHQILETSSVDIISYREPKAKTIALDCSRFNGDFKLNYSPEAYGLHEKATQRLAMDHDNFNIHTSQNKLLSKIYASTKNNIAIVKQRGCFNTTFVFHQETLVRTISEFALLAIDPPY